MFLSRHLPNGKIDLSCKILQVGIEHDLQQLLLIHSFFCECASIDRFAVFFSASLYTCRPNGNSCFWMLCGSRAKEMVSVYRHMSDKEAAYLLEHSILPDTQPYQTIVVGEEGYEYCTLSENQEKRWQKHCAAVKSMEILLNTFQSPSRHSGIVFLFFPQMW